MPSRSEWGLTPRESIGFACARRGEAEVVGRCIDLLAGREVDDELVFAIGGPLARRVLEGAQQYWLRVWALRAMLYAWDEAARPWVCGGLADEAWRVREMAAKVARRRLVGEALEELVTLADDPVARVRAAAARAVVALTGAGA